MTINPAPFVETRQLFPSLCWKAIFGGTVAAIGIHILLTALGVGAGLATFSPTADANPVKNFSVGAAIIWSVCALIALWFGGVVAGRFSHSVHSGFVHGMLVWSLTLIITLLLLSMGTGMILGGAMKVLGEGMGIGASSVAAEGAQRTADELKSFGEEAALSVPSNSTPMASVRAKREVGFAMTKLFAPGNDIKSGDNRAAAIKAVMDSSQMSEADATRMVDGWITSYENLKTELARLADQAAHKISCAAIWSFFALLIGLLVTSLGGSCGAKRAWRHAELESSSKTTL